MKTESRNLGKLAIVALAFTLAFSTPTLANGGDKDNNPGTEFKFIGNVENQPVFELNLGNEEDEYTVTFRDEASNILFTDKFKGANLIKKFLLKSEDLGDTTLNVTVRSKKNNTTAVYVINKNLSYVEETVVNKVK